MAGRREEHPPLSGVERQIREAQARGDFDNLPGAGKPLRLGDPDDPNWWVKSLIEREQLDMTGALPGPLQLRKEAATYPESLVDVPREAMVREILEDYNRRVKYDRLNVLRGESPPVVAPTVDVDDLVARWAALRQERAEHHRELAAVPDSEAPARRRWWHRGRR